MERLKERSESEGLSLAELVRRAVDAFLAWDDPMYTPAPVPGRPQKERAFHPHVSSAGAFRRGVR